MGFPAGRTAAVFAELFPVLSDCLAVNYPFGFRYASRTTSPLKKRKPATLRKARALCLTCLGYRRFGHGQFGNEIVKYEHPAFISLERNNPTGFAHLVW